jgi:hypothetical protein
MDSRKVEIKVSGTLASGKSTLIYLIKEMLREKGFNVRYDPDEGYKFSEERFDERVGGTVDDAIKFLKEQKDIEIDILENRVKYSRSNNSEHSNNGCCNELKNIPDFENKNYSYNLSVDKNYYYENYEFVLLKTSRNTGGLALLENGKLIIYNQDELIEFEGNKVSSFMSLNIVSDETPRKGEYVLDGDSIRKVVEISVDDDIMRGKLYLDGLASYTLLNKKHKKLISTTNWGVTDILKDIPKTPYNMINSFVKSYNRGNILKYYPKNLTV